MKNDFQEARLNWNEKLFPGGWTEQGWIMIV
jgi:hypothetical protein